MNFTVAPPMTADEAERAALGAALWDPSDPGVAARVVGALRDDCIESHRHQLITEAIRAMVERGEQVDRVTVADELRRAGNLEDAGGADYLVDLEQSCPTSAMALTYCRIIADVASSRRQQAIRARLMDDLESGRDIREAMAEAQSRLVTETDGVPAGRRGVVMVAPPASEITPLPVNWLWDGWLARGMLATVAGEPKVGKSVMLRALAAAVSCGAPLPGDPRHRDCEAVLLVSLEDDAARVVVPSLKSMGADLGRVHLYTGLRTPEGPAGLVLPDHVSAMADLSARIGPALIVIDPLVAVESMRLDTHRQRDMRAVLEPLRRLAADTGAAVVVVRHTRKGEAAEPTHRIMGSMDAVAAARTVLVVGRDPEKPERRAVAVAATNLGAAPDPRSFTVGDDGKLLWDKTSAPDLTPARLLEAPATAEERNALRQAEDLIRDMLKGGPVPTADLQSAATANGISERTLNRARKKLNVKATKGSDGWTVSLPSEAKVAAGSDEGGHHETNKELGTVGTLDESRTGATDGASMPTVPAPVPEGARHPSEPGQEVGEL